MGTYGVGQAVRRIEDARLLTGHGRYLDDVDLDGQAHAVFVRSPYAHADIAAVDTGAAYDVPGVRAVHTVADLDAAGYGDIPCLAPKRNRDGTSAAMPRRPCLARGRARHVGDPVAVVVADTAEAAREGAEAVMLDVTERDAVVDAQAALAPDAPQIWDEAPGNLCVDYGVGDTGAVERAMREAAHRTEITLINNRVVANSLEPRGAIGAIEPETGRYLLYASSQGSHQLREWLAGFVLNVPEDRLHVVTPDVGGGFGTKIFLYPEYPVLLFAAERLGRPVKWVETRNEAFQSDTQGRDQTATVELALDAGHRITALRFTSVANAGAYLSNFGSHVPTGELSKMLSGAYRIPAIAGRIRLAFTNTVPVDAYRGAGRPEAAYFIERAVDAAAHDLDVAPAELRRRNFVARAEMPYTTATGLTYDSGDFEAVMDDALGRADAADLDARKAEARRRGKLRGLGMAYYVEACGAVGGDEARVRVRRDGGVILDVGTQTNGQGHATAYAQLLADRLGVAPDRVEVRQGDSDALPSGGGTEGSRSLLVGGGATDRAAENVVEKARRIAAHAMEVSPADIEAREGLFTVAGTDKVMRLPDIAEAAERADLPADLRGGLDAGGSYEAPAMTYPNGCHVCELEVDEATGVPTIARYVVVDDFGMVLNPMLVTGQVHGGVAQGIGQALYENTAYEAESGQLLTASYMDYTMPRADGVPPVEVAFHNVPCATNPFGIKGAGEAGAIGAPPAVMNALVDALRPVGVHHIDMPATSARIWSLLARKAAA